MEANLEKHLNNLKDILLKLDHSGSDGFEGMLAKILYSITGIPFRLAGSGSQFGLDGKASFRGDPVCFECKRYDSSPSRESVLAKITDFKINHREIDLWVLASTASIKTQLIDDVRKVSESDGFFVFVLDYSNNSLPKLGAVIAECSEITEEFIRNNAKCSLSLLETLSPALGAIKSSKFQPNIIKRIKSELEVPYLSYSFARQANQAWMESKFSDRAEAKVHFGQPICPNSNQISTIITRPTLISKIEQHLKGNKTNEVVVLKGKEGAGKSWILAQSWLHQKDKPILLFFSPQEFSTKSNVNDFKSLLIQKLIKQTDSKLSHISTNRWERLVEQWEESESSENLNKKIVILIDGINQIPKNDWAVIIDTIYIETKKLNVSIFVSTRKPYFDSFIKNRIESPVKEIEIPEWTVAERDKILSLKDIKVKQLNEKVASSLCNPRLLSISLDLLTKEKIEDLKELSVSRLLIEHIRTMERDAIEQRPFDVFAQGLVSDANEIQKRIQTGQKDDLKVFENELEKVVDGRFYEILEDEPTSYYLKEDGVTLALGFAIISNLRKALRNNRSLYERLMTIIEPIQALDNTADVVMAAITIASIDDKCPEEILINLVSCFTEIQNINHKDFSVFYRAAKEKPEVFFQAAKFVLQNVGINQNFEWLQIVLIHLSRSDNYWEKIEEGVLESLRFYSLSPELSPLDKKDINKTQKKIDEKVNQLSDYEKEILSYQLRNDSFDSSKLSSLVFTLLAGKPLKKYVSNLFHWKFSQSLNSNYVSSSSSDFKNLIRFNNIDWELTKIEFIKHLEILEHDTVSKTGKWALFDILNALSDHESGMYSEELHKKLRSDIRLNKGWRLIESYCASDPCDPKSLRPENINLTIKKIKNIDNKNIATSRYSDTEDHAIAYSANGLCRFEPIIAINKYKEIIAESLKREGEELRQGLFFSSNHSFLIDKELRKKIIDKYLSINPLSEAGTDSWWTSNLLLKLAFPKMSSSEQALFFISNDMMENMTLELLSVLKKPDEKLLNEICGVILEEKNKNKNKIYLLLIYLRFTKSNLSNEMLDLIKWAWTLNDYKTKSEICALSASTKSKPLLFLVIDSNLAVSSLKTDVNKIKWNLSNSLLQSFKLNYIGYEVLFSRVDKKFYGLAVRFLDTKEIKFISSELDKALKNKLNPQFLEKFNDIKLELDLEDNDAFEPKRYSISKNKIHLSEVDKIESFFKEESIEEYKQNQKEASDTFSSIKEGFDEKLFNVIIDEIDDISLERIVKINNEIINNWFDLFINLNDSEIRLYYNFILKFSFAIRNEDYEKTLVLLELLKKSSPWIVQYYGITKMNLFSSVLWRLDNSYAKELKYKILDECVTDDELATEVLSALYFNNQALIEDYVKIKINVKAPSEIARGIMVTGFSDQSEFNDKVLENFEDTKGLTYYAYDAAKYAYERNSWSKIWFEKMREAENIESFWCYFQLFKKIVDKRYILWNDEKPEYFDQFEFMINDQLKNRFKRQESKRSKKLFGLELPNSVFIKNGRCCFSNLKIY